MAAGEKTVVLAKLEPQDLLRLAVEHKADIATLERLVALAKDMQAVQAKQAWHEAMTRFQAACPALKKESTGKIDTERAHYEYRYSSIDEMMKVARPVFAANDLVVTWRHPEAREGSVASVCRIAHVLGHHEESGAVELPISFRTDRDRGGANNAQRVGMALTYADRYAFKAISGLTPEGEDDDSGGGHEDAAPAAPIDENAPVLIVDVKEQTGNKKFGKGTWTKWQITFSDGRVAGTFTKGLAAECRKLQQAGSTVVPVLEQDGAFTNLTDLKLPDGQRVQDAPEEPASPPVEGDRGDHIGAIRTLADRYVFTDTERMGVTKLILKGKTMGKAATADLVNLRAFLEDQQAVSDWRAEFKRLAEEPGVPF